MQVGRVVAAVAVLGAVVGGCGGPAQAGSAVIVGSTTVPLEQVQSRLDVALGRTEQLAQLTAQGATPADIARDIVTREVLHDLVARSAAQLGIPRVTDAEVDEELAAAGGAETILQTSLYDAPALRERVRDEELAARIARRTLPGLAVTADLIAATSRAEADTFATVLAAGGPGADALFAANQQTSRRGVTYEAAATPEAAATVLFGAPEGSTVVFRPNPQQSSWIVFRITDRSTDAPVDPAAVSAISRSDLATIGERMVQPLGDAVGVRVNPRYGVWDPIQMRVVAADATAGEILPAAG